MAGNVKGCSKSQASPFCGSRQSKRLMYHVTVAKTSLRSLLRYNLLSFGPFFMYGKSKKKENKKTNQLQQQPFMVSQCV